MTEDWPFKSSPQGECDEEESEPDTSNWYEPATEPGAETYASLPEHGVSHYAVPDAALVCALDLHWSGRSGLKVTGSMEDDESPSLREALEPLRRRIVASLMRAVMSGEVPGEVKRREFDGAPLQDWTFVKLTDVQRWAYRRALGANGGYLRRFFQREADLTWDFGTFVVADRLRFQQAQAPIEDGVQDLSILTESEKDDEIRRLTEKLAATRQESRSLRFAEGQKELDPRERTSLLKIAVALAQGQEGFDLHSVSAHKQLVLLLEKSGLTMSGGNATRWVSELRRAHDAKRSAH